MTPHKDINHALLKLYIDGSDRELEELGVTRDEVLRRAREHEDDGWRLADLARSAIQQTLSHDFPDEETIKKVGNAQDHIIAEQRERISQLESQLTTLRTETIEMCAIVAESSGCPMPGVPREQWPTTVIAESIRALSKTQEVGGK